MGLRRGVAHVAVVAPDPSARWRRRVAGDTARGPVETSAVDHTLRGGPRLHNNAAGGRDLTVDPHLEHAIGGSRGLHLRPVLRFKHRAGAGNHLEARVGAVRPLCGWGKLIGEQLVIAPLVLISQFQELLTLGVHR